MVEVDGSRIYKKKIKKFRLGWHYAKRATKTTLTFLTFFQEAQTISIIESFQQVGRNDLVKLQMEKIGWIRKLEQDYSEKF